MMTNTTTKKICGFYGSLRKEGYNFRRIFGDGANTKQLGTIELDGYIMADLGPYPKIFRGDGKVLFEVFELTNEREINFVIGMEQGAGYEEVIVDTQEYGKVTIYVGEGELNPKYHKAVGSGDWIAYCKENRKHY